MSDVVFFIFEITNMFTRFEEFKKMDFSLEYL